MDYTKRYQSGSRGLPVAHQAIYRSAGRISVRRRKRPSGRGKTTDAIPFDAPRIEAIKLNHRGPRCTFEAIVEDFAVSDPSIQKLALIVRAADIKGEENAAAEGVGLRSIAQGFAAMGLSDEERLAAQFPIYDALYAFVQNKK
jgi:hypothetical protein